MSTVRDRVDRRLVQFLDVHPAPVADPEVVAAHQVLREFILGDGKRIRPLLCYWGWVGAGGADCAELISAAASLELCHAGLLIHDDIMDASEVRRGRPTVHRALAGMHAGPAANAFGRAAAILMGVLALGWSDELFATSGVEPHRLRRGHELFTAMRTEVIAGQYLDVMSQTGADTTVDRAYTVIRYKTAKYTVERPLQIGGALAGGDEELLEAYSSFGVPLGEAFQLRDDILGMFGDPEVTGKSALDDLREGKQTVLIAYATRYGSRAETEHLRAWLGDPKLTETVADELRQIVVDTGALAQVEQMIDERAGTALSALADARITAEAAAALTELADRIAHRTR
ncbi:polyprenyl synthetase family protein [Nonomuraea sediminis]|uniref:polyprenyl synthetase family protein n=1 Tax=Nonomuraea sediminis TaxID=2835864 RepID=UPI001BDC05EA|nr:polyprenyl synthetase family protein [Nonomuraea sediminis]